MIAEQFDVFFLDLDGTVYLGEKLLPGASESLARLRREGKTIRFLTNDPRSTRDECARRLMKLGIEASAEEVVTSGWATAKYLRENEIRSVYVVGSLGLVSEIRDMGIEVTEQGSSCEAVVVGGHESVSYHHIWHASRIISRRGARFIATNPDGFFPLTDGPLPATGAIAAAIQASTGKRPIFVGKPYPAMFESALKGLRTSTKRIALIGDNPSTDMLGAHQAGIGGILISNKPIQFPSARDYRTPDATISKLSFLFDPQTTARRWEKPSFPWPERITVGVAAIVFDNSNRVLLLGEKANYGLLELPSGDVEPGETVEEAVERTVNEKTGVQVKVKRLVGVYSDPASQVFSFPMEGVVQIVIIYFQCKIVDGSLQTNCAKGKGAAFFGTDELPTDILPLHSQWLSDALSGG